MIALEMHGLKEVMAKFSRAAEGDWITEGIEDAANIALGEAQKWCPKDSGDLHDSIAISPLPDGFTLEAGGTTINSSGIDYSIFQEFFSSPYTSVGTPESPIAATDTQGNMAFRPFLRPALIKARDMAKDEFGKKLYRIMEL